jgi:hypothetical protein
VTVERALRLIAGAEDHYGSLLGVHFAEPFQARGPLLVSDPTAFAKVPFG